MKTKSLYLLVALGMMLGFSSCNLNYFPSDEQSTDVIMKEASDMIIDGCYATLKDEVEYLGYPSGNTYCRHYFQMAEFPADNICLSGRSTDPLFQATTYTMTDNLQNVGTLWMLGYKVIYMANTLIETLDENDDTKKQIIGEAYFVRAMMHFHLVTLYAKPYSMGRDNMGVPLNTKTVVNPDSITRNPVGDVYDQVVKDLQKAASLMGASRGNAGYPSHDAALGLLSRVYLYMGDYDNCIATVQNMLGGDESEANLASKLDDNFAKYFANAKSSKETLFCIAHEMNEDRGQSSIGSMYNKDGGGWGEIYPSFSLLNLYERYPMDIRYSEYIIPQYKNGAAPSNTYTAYIPIPSDESKANAPRNCKPQPVTDDGTGVYSFSEGGVVYTIENRLVNGEYIEHHLNYNGEDLLVRIEHSNIDVRNTFPRYYVTKFGYQDGVPTLCSPVCLRWGEVLLNAAEAYARNQDDDNALKYVNVIRHRAGIPDAGLFSTGNMHGYTDVKEVVMDERRMELAFEGHRMFDVYRNQQNMNREYPGYQEWKVIPYTEPHTQYPIPEGELKTSGIPKNPGY